MDKRMPETAQKSSSSADRFRAAGNQAFKLRSFACAIQLYNESLCYAPAGSVEMSLAYGNKSAVYCEMGKYALALENTKLARKTGYPAEKIEQLDAREEKCKKLMEKFGSDENFEASLFFKLSHPPNEKIPIIAGCLELHKNEKYGRHIITNKDLKTGDIIAIEKPVMAFATDNISKHCCFFCAKSDILIPCSHCTGVMFCSEACKEKAAPTHLNDAFYGAYSGMLKDTLKMQLEAYRIAGGVDEALELLKDSKGKTVFDFDFSDLNDPDYEENMLIALNGLYKSTQKHEMKVDPDQLLNVPPINEKPRTVKKRKQLLKLIKNQFRISVANNSIYKKNFLGIFLFRSLLNHSCAPNIQFGIFDDKMVSFACRPIKASEQLFASYGIQANSHSREERQMMLIEAFQFKCDCEACDNDWPQQFPRKDRNFVEPENVNHEPSAAIELFKKNCKYIEKNVEKMPCYEVAKLMHTNYHLILSLAGYDLVDYSG